MNRSDLLQEPFRALYHPTIMAEGPISKWRHFAPEIILCAVRWYLRYSLSYREVQELLEERDLRVDWITPPFGDGFSAILPNSNSALGLI